MLTLAFDTATSVATAALVRDGEVLGERASRAVRVLEDAAGIFRESGADPAELTGIVVGTGPGSFTGMRMGVAAARGLSLALDVPVAIHPTFEPFWAAPVRFKRLGRALNMSPRTIQERVVRSLTLVPYASVTVKTDVPATVRNYLLERSAQAQNAIRRFARCRFDR